MGKRQRRLAAIMFTDIVGYSAMMQKDEAITSRLRNRHRTVFSKLTEQFDGEILQYYGDGTLSVFYSTAAAVECAIEIQRELKKDPKVPLRIGIHTGDITFSEEDVFGDGVNIASRIESLCVPGGVLVSGKVYDDIKNHPTIRAKSMGAFGLKNIRNNIPVFAITNPGVTLPEQELGTPSPTHQQVRQFTSSDNAELKFRKNKNAAAKLAFPFGVLGVHRFYLGQTFYGILYPLLFLFGLVEGLAFFIIAPPVISFLDMLLFKNMSEEEFNAKYNRTRSRSRRKKRRSKNPSTIHQHRAQEEQFSKHKSSLKTQFIKYKRAGEQYLNNYNFKSAIVEFQKANELKYDDAPVHFYLARCYSMLEDTKNALTHLDAAIAFGIPPQKIKTTDDLAYLRVQPEFKDFEKSNYRFSPDFKPIANPEGKQSISERKSRIKTKPAPEEQLDAPPPDFLEKLQKLSELREKGYLTEEEFIQQKEKLRLK